jgi:hypothetical protein
MRAREAEAEEMARRILLAEDHFRRGEQALRREALELAQREFAEATRLNPEEQEYRALLAWTTFAAAADKPALAARTRAELERAGERGPQERRAHGSTSAASSACSATTPRRSGAFARCWR